MRRALAIAATLVCVASAAFAAEPPAEAVLATLPFLGAVEDVAAEVRVDLAPEGARSLPLLLDTGSPDSFATPRAAQDLGISLRRSKQTPYRRATRLGRDLALTVDTRRGEQAAAQGGEWAVVGGRFLASYVLEIDVPARRVRFLDPERFEVPEKSDAANEDVLPIRLVNNRPIVQIEVGAARVPAAISTGAPGTLLLPGGHAADAGLEPDPGAPAEIAPMAGAGRLEPKLAPRIRIGKFETSGVPVLVAEHGAQGAGPKSDAILGLELLQRFAIRIDYPRRRLWIAER
ncbi:MAG: hypothetical protein DCC71_24395 [Proteobacteria bacterium]|nr:MAG: hypothetical protein DCC71_24395 [Pseudomonadota bacterium]